MASAADTTIAPSRRRLLAASGLALPLAAVSAGAAAASRPPRDLLLALTAMALPAAAVPAAEPNPDAEMVRLCGVYLAATDHYNEAEYTEAEGMVLYQRILAIEDEIEALPPQTMAGVMAKARTALALAEREPSGDWDTGPASDWARDVVLDLTRLYGSAA